eukprot:gb/GEZN01000852.1/.p1 GENE.gb/GEZN01000852.1/~~gb/GEZN01000852.1/.p1  ORF type:complete len:480 (-),score=118.37 gb/GEZN01000852.1/:758-2197(-)
MAAQMNQKQAQKMAKLQPAKPVPQYGTYDEVVKAHADVKVTGGRSGTRKRTKAVKGKSISTIEEMMNELICTLQSQPEPYLEVAALGNVLERETYKTWNKHYKTIFNKLSLKKFIATHCKEELVVDGQKVYLKETFVELRGEEEKERAKKQAKKERQRAKKNGQEGGGAEEEEDDEVEGLGKRDGGRRGCCCRLLDTLFLWLMLTTLALSFLSFRAAMRQASGKPLSWEEALEQGLQDGQDLYNEHLAPSIKEIKQVSEPYVAKLRKKTQPHIKKAWVQIEPHYKQARSKITPYVNKVWLQVEPTVTTVTDATVKFLKEEAIPAAKKANIAIAKFTQEKAIPAISNAYADTGEFCKKTWATVKPGLHMAYTEFLKFVDKTRAVVKPVVQEAYNAASKFVRESWKAFVPAMNNAWKKTKEFVTEQQKNLKPALLAAKDKAVLFYTKSLVPFAQEAAKAVVDASQQAVAKAQALYKQMLGK